MEISCFKGRRKVTEEWKREMRALSVPKKGRNITNLRLEWLL
jgi:hypothetical protein